MLVTSKSKKQSTQELVKTSVDVLVKALEAGYSEVLSAYLQAMAKFHYYSFNNILLIAMQRPRATKVAGLRRWNELGRRVRRGEKGIMILAPLIGKDKRRSSEVNGDEAKTNTEPDRRLLGFRAVYVFDVTQTEGAELPEPTTVKGDVGDKLEKLVRFTQDREIKLEYSDSITPARGMSYGGLIRILPGMEPAEEFSTLVHELAH